MPDSWSEDPRTRPLDARTAYVIDELVLLPKGSSREARFSRNRITVGTAADCDLVLRDDSVSRVHAEIRRYEDLYRVRDLDSTNGTFIREVRVIEAVLAPETEIRFGAARVVFAPSRRLVEVRPLEETKLGLMVGVSPAMRRMFDFVRKVAPTDATLLLEGETGTGKEALARTVHLQSSRAGRALVVVDCSTIPRELFESELFGHERGSFSGAISCRKGLVEEASGGTLLLDEVGELPLDVQPKLLRFLETGEVRRVGASRSVSVDVRIIAATNRNLVEMVAEGRFREDLFYRLNVLPVTVPPLRERREDIPLLVRHFLATAPFNRMADGTCRVLDISPGALAQWNRYDFPGNVRELLNLLERSVALADSPIIESLPQTEVSVRRARKFERPGLARACFHPGEELLGFKEAKDGLVAQFERAYLEDLLDRSGGNLAQAARSASMDRKHLRELLKKYGLRD